MNYADLKELSDEQLVHAELSLERTLVTARFQHATNQLADSSQLKKLRRDIARIRTACRTRESEGGLRKNALRDQHATSFQAAAADTSGASAAQGGGFLKGIVDKIGGDE
ncbi:MAG: 50S ribosomal protein L29 [Proteobacteria bacterium]|nr:50S ribosomal protein L29 [Pseudomonadota bacterium]MCP4918236.1 50S ribosomal protein L29 [Pseudomonadota bacterium]